MRRVSHKVRDRDLIIGTAIFVVAGSALFYGYGYVNFYSLFNSGYPSSTTPILTTLPAIKNGTFPSSYDKQGTGGTLVQVNRVQVLGVTNEIDGDIHIDVTDGSTGTIVTEITPIAQRYLNGSYPAVGSTISVIGTPYCDVAHQGEAWHGGTCFEIHPLTLWKPYGAAIPPPASLAANRFTFLPEPSDES